MRELRSLYVCLGLAVLWMALGFVLMLVLL